MLGALIGDIVGSVYEFNNIKTKNFPLFNSGSMYTDDSVMTLAVAEICQNGYINDKEKIIDTLKKWGCTYPNAGYGGHFYNWVLGDDRRPYNSCGNGSAMRVSACGWYGKTENEVIDYATKVTEVTHNHPEGIKGAVVTALCIYYARTGKSKEYIKEYVEKEYPEIKKLDYEELRRTYEHGPEICQVTMPQALYCFLKSNSFEDCIRTTISIGGDCDTTAAISGAIAEAFYKDQITDEILHEVFNRIPMPRNDCDAYAIIKKFIDYKNQLNDMTIEETIKITYDYAVKIYGDKPKLLNAYQNEENYYFFYVSNSYNGEVLIGQGLVGINKQEKRVFYVSSAECGEIIYNSKKMPKKAYETIYKSIREYSKE